MQEAENISIYRRRREQLARAMGPGVAVIPTAPERVRNRDSHFPYRFDSHFYYLTGFAEPEAVLVLTEGKSILFCRERNPEREVWDGFRYGPERARERFGFDEAHPGAALDEMLARLLENQPALFYPVGDDAQWDSRAMQWLNAVRAKVRADGITDLDEMFFSSTHDESAPDTIGISGPDDFSSGVNPFYVQFLIERTAQSIEQAHAALRPARIRFGQIRPQHLRRRRRVGEIAPRREGLRKECVVHPYVQQEPRPLLGKRHTLDRSHELSQALDLELLPRGLRRNRRTSREHVPEPLAPAQEQRRRHQHHRPPSHAHSESQIHAGRTRRRRAPSAIASPPPLPAPAPLPVPRPHRPGASGAAPTGPCALPPPPVARGRARRRAPRTGGPHPLGT